MAPVQLFAVEEELFVEDAHRFDRGAAEGEAGAAQLVDRRRLREVAAAPAEPAVIRGAEEGASLRSAPRS